METMHRSRRHSSGLLIDPQQFLGIADLPCPLECSKPTRCRLQVGDLGKTRNIRRPPAVVEGCNLHPNPESHPTEPLQSLRFAPMGQRPRLVGGV